MNRSVIDKNYSFIKRMVNVFASISVTGTTPTLLKWNYPTFNAGPNVRTYTAANIPTTPLPTGTGPWPLQYVNGGSEGAYSISRTGTGLYTLVLQDNYQRLVDLRAYASVAGGTPTFAQCTENTSISNLGATPGTGIIGLAFWDFAGAAVDPVGVVRLHLTLADASEP